MTARPRRGYTLIELLVGLVLTLLVSFAIYQALIGSQRLQRSLFARMDTQQSARSVALFLSSQVRELSATDGDLQSVTASQIRYRGPRWAAITCSPLTVGGGYSIKLRNDRTFGATVPTVGDSVMLYLEGVAERREDDAWAIGVVTAVAASTCDLPDVGASRTLSITLRSSDDVPVEAPFQLGVFRTVPERYLRGGPVRGFRVDELLPTTVDGLTWLGRRTALTAGSWSATEPLIGPIAATNGVQYALFTTAGAATTTLTAAATMQITVRPLSREVGWFGGLNARHADSLVTRIALRNNARF